MDHQKANLKDRGSGQCQEDVQLEFGDLIFTLVNVARLARFHPETAVAAAIRKFEHRFRWMEKSATARGQSLEDIQRSGLEKLWITAKQMEFSGDEQSGKKD